MGIRVVEDAAVILLTKTQQFDQPALHAATYTKI
jgi:hypothetical protein